MGSPRCRELLLTATVDLLDRSAAYAADVVVQGDAEPAARPVLDDKKPSTTLQIRLHNGQRLRETLNLDHTLRDLHAIIQLYVDCVLPWWGDNGLMSELSLSVVAL